jgi:hypothetical protein
MFHWTDHMSQKPDTCHQLPALAPFTRWEAATRKGIEEVGGMPTGLILYDMRVFNTKPPHFSYEWTDETQSQKGSTEDCFQTRNMSMAWYASKGKLGGKLFCAWDCWANHIQAAVHRGRHDLRNVRRRGEAWLEVERPDHDGRRDRGEERGRVRAAERLA